MSTLSDNEPLMRDTDLRVTARPADAALGAEADDYLAALDLWPDEPDPDPRAAGLWRGAAAIAIAGVATIVLLSAVVLQSACGAALSIWIPPGLPIVLLAAFAARLTAGRRNRVAVQRGIASTKRAARSRAG
jgi:hypothetical protein